MHLFDPERPTLASGRKRLILGAKNAVPSFDVEPISETQVQLDVMLRYDDSKGYIWYSCICLPSELNTIMAEYIIDPETTLQNRFNWDPAKVVYEPKRITQNFAPTIKTEPRRKGSVGNIGQIDETLDLDNLD